LRKVFTLAGVHNIPGMPHSFYNAPGLLAVIHASAALGTSHSMIEWRDLSNPDFAGMARAMRILDRRVEDPGELPNATADLLKHDGPALLDVVTAKQELSMPPTITPEEVRGSSLWAPARGHERSWRRGNRPGQNEFASPLKSGHSKGPAA